MVLIKKDNKITMDIMWKAVSDVGLEHLFLQIDGDHIIANSVILTMKENNPIRVFYKVCCNLQWEVSEFSVEIFHGGYKNISVKRDFHGNWRTDQGKLLENLKGCIDIDISATPFTNTIPINRLSLKPGECKEIKVVYVDIHNFSLTPVNQRYTCLEAKINTCKYKYENLDSGFEAEFFVDKNGLVIDYPNLCERVCNIDTCK